jgi:predicted Fe-S protein YdhL (DUF1289 family)
MNDEIWQRAETDSPCIKLCVMHPRAAICMGCYRSIEEITAWTGMTVEARETLALELPSRADRIKPARRGGRASRRG